MNLLSRNSRIQQTDFNVFGFRKCYHNYESDTMKSFLKIPTVITISLFLLIPLSCSDDKCTNPQNSNLAVVTGEVTFIYDNVAADGGVIIDLKLDNGKAERLLFSPYYWGDDSEERWQLYAKIQEVEVGDRVRGRGQRTDRGIELEELTILEK